MKRYFETTALKFIISLERPEVVANLEASSELMELIKAELFQVARSEGLLPDEGDLPLGTLCRVMEATPYLVVRMVIPPRLI
jgi:hypothetical protein